MNTQNILVLLITAVLIASPSYGFNITQMLDEYPEFSNFNSLLSRTGVASEINRRQTLTVLALDDSQSTRINGMSSEAITEIMAIHVALEYYDKEKFDDLSKNGSAMMTNLYQTTGKANSGEGFVNVSVSQGQVKFASGASGAQPDTQLVRIVATQPYNISIIEVSNPIVPPGLDHLGPASAQAPRKMGPPPPPPEPSNPTPSPSPEEAESPTDDGGQTPSPSPSDAPEPSSDSPSDSPSSDDFPDSDPKKSSGIRFVTTSSGLLLIVAALAAQATL